MEMDVLTCYGDAHDSSNLSCRLKPSYVCEIYGMSNGLKSQQPILPSAARGLDLLNIALRLQQSVWRPWEVISYAQEARPREILIIMCISYKVLISASYTIK